MHYPYRQNEQVKNETVDIETDDVHIEVIYLNSNNETKKQTIDFIGNPTATLYPDGDILKRERKGSEQSRSWINDYVGNKQIVYLENKIIPMHRVLEINIRTETRTQTVEVLKRNS